MSNITYFEIPASDMNRARNFYASLFDWNFEKTPGPGDYWMTQTSEENGNCGVAGGLYQRGDSAQPILDYIGVSSVSEYLGKVQALGGKIITPKTAASSYGYYAICQDTEDNTFGLWEEDKNAK